MLNTKTKNPNAPRPFSTNYIEIPSDELLNNRNLPTANQRNNYQTDPSLPSGHSNGINLRNHDDSSNLRIARFVRFVNKTLPRSNSGSRSRNTENIICPSE